MERILQDLGVFVGMTEAINSDLDLERVLRAVTDAGTRLSGARVGAFFHRPDGPAEDAGQVGDTPTPVLGAPVLSGVDGPGVPLLPLGVVAELFAPTFAGHGSVRFDDLRTDPRTRALGGHAELRSCLGTPVVARSGEVIGALIFGHPEPGRFDGRSADVVRLVATQAAVAVENARLYAAEQQARVGAEHAARRLVLLQEITSRLARSSTREEVVRAVVETLVGPLDLSRIGVFLLEDGQLRAFDRVTVEAGPSGPPAAQVRLLALDEDNPVSQCARERVPLVYASADDIAARHTTYSSRVSGIETALILPLVVGDRVLGVLGLGWQQPHPVDELEVEWLSSAAEQLAQALRQVELHDSERAAQEALSASATHAIAVSQTLQRSLLPPALPHVEDLAVAVRYLPGSEDAEVGGDWYDLIALPDGGVVLVIGDVQGHSIGAAAVMGQLRVALNAYLVEGHQPEAAMSRVNRVMETLQTDVIATCCLVSLDPATGLASVVRAGHTLPLVRRGDGSVEELDGDAGIPLGVLPEWAWTASSVELAAGDRLLLYTDGLVEVPGADLEDGVGELAHALGSTWSGSASPTGVAERVPAGAARQARLEADVDAVLAAVGPRGSDDVAVLACEYAGPSWSFRRAELDVTAVTQLGAARAFTRETLGAWGLTRLVDTVELLVTEMVTNALVHTEGPAGLELRRQDGVVRVLVTDPLSRVPRHRAVQDGDTGGRGLLVVGALAVEWGVEPSGEGKTVWADVLA